MPIDTAYVVRRDGGSSGFTGSKARASRREPLVPLLPRNSSAEPGKRLNHKVRSYVEPSTVRCVQRCIGLAPQHELCGPGFFTDFCASALSSFFTQFLQHFPSRASTASLALYRSSTHFSVLRAWHHPIQTARCSSISRPTLLTTHPLISAPSPSSLLSPNRTRGQSRPFMLRPLLPRSTTGGLTSRPSVSATVSHNCTVSQSSNSSSTVVCLGAVAYG